MQIKSIAICTTYSYRNGALKLLYPPKSANSLCVERPLLSCLLRLLSLSFSLAFALALGGFGSSGSISSSSSGGSSLGSSGGSSGGSSSGLGHVGEGSATDGLGGGVGFGFSSESLVCSERGSTSLGRIDDHDHANLAMLGLSTVDSNWGCALNWHTEGCFACSASGDGDETGVELAGRLASLGWVAGSGSVVLVEELEADSVTDGSVDGGWGEDELLVASNLDGVGGSESQGGVEHSNERGLGEEHFDQRKERRSGGCVG